MKKLLLTTTLTALGTPLVFAFACGKTTKGLPTFVIDSNTSDDQFSSFIKEHKGETVRFLQNGKYKDVKVTSGGTLKWKLNELKTILSHEKQLWHWYTNTKNENFKVLNPTFGPIGDTIVSDKFYNYLMKRPEFDKEHDVTFAIIANRKIYTEVIPLKEDNEVAWDVIRRATSFNIYGWDSKDMGIWMAAFQLRQDDGTWSHWKHGASNMKNHTYPIPGDAAYSPMWYENRRLSNFGISNYHVAPGEIYEITYDNGAT